MFGPLTAALERALGWRDAVLVLAAVLAVVTGPGFALGLRRRAAQRPEGASAGSVQPDTVPSEAFRRADFWLLTVAYLLAAVTTFGVAVHLVPFLHERGMSTETAAAALGAVGFVQVVGRGTFIRLSARQASVHLATWVLAAKAAGLALLLVVPGLPGLVAFVVVYGSSNGVSTLTRAATIAELYGAAHYGAISAMIASISAVGGALAPFAVAAVGDSVGSMTPALAGLVALSIVSAAANEVVARPTRRPPQLAAVEPAAISPDS